MHNISLEQVETLADQLSAEEQKQLVDHLTRKVQNGNVSVNPARHQPQDLYGIWKGAFPETFDIDATLHEVRHEWEKEWPEVFGQ